MDMQGIRDKMATEQTAKNQAIATADAENNRQNPTEKVHISDSQILEIKQAYIQDLKSRGKSSTALMVNSCQFDLKDDYNLHITVLNEILKLQLEDEKVNISAVSQRIIPQIVFNITYQVSNENTPIADKKHFYSDKDKAKKMIELNPALADLIKKFNINIE